MKKNIISLLFTFSPPPFASDAPSLEQSESNLVHLSLQIERSLILFGKALIQLLIWDGQNDIWKRCTGHHFKPLISGYGWAGQNLLGLPSNPSFICSLWAAFALAKLNSKCRKEPSGLERRPCQAFNLPLFGHCFGGHFRKHQTLFSIPL